MRNEDVKLETFPRTHHEALAMLYVQTQITVTTTPEDLHTMYKDALDAIQKSSRSNPIYR